MTLAAFIISLEFVPFFKHSKSTMDSLSHFIAVCVQFFQNTPKAHLEESRGGKEDDDLGTVPSTVPMSSMSKPAPLDPTQFSLSRHGHPVQNGGIFFESKSLGAAPNRVDLTTICTGIMYLLVFSLIILTWLK